MKVPKMVKYLSELLLIEENVVIFHTKISLNGLKSAE